MKLKEHNMDPFNERYKSKDYLAVLDKMGVDLTKTLNDADLTVHHKVLFLAGLIGTMLKNTSRDLGADYSIALMKQVMVTISKYWGAELNLKDHEKGN